MNRRKVKRILYTMNPELARTLSDRPAEKSGLKDGSSNQWMEAEE